MKFNDKELAIVAGLPADKEGRLNHKGNSHRDVYREKWFKLKRNLLFYYRLNEYGAVANQEKPDGVFVIEQCKVQMEPNADSLFAFSITFAGEDKKHLFCDRTEKHCEKWIKILEKASYESLRYRLLQLKLLLEKKTGQDPLKKFGVKVQFNSSSLQPVNKSSIPRNNSAPSTVWLLDLNS